MLDAFRGISLVAATITMGLITGAFALYAHTIMPGLKATDDRTFVTAFQSMDRAIINPWFMVGGFVGALVFTGVAAALHLGSGARSVLLWVAVAFVLYLVAFPYAVGRGTFAAGSFTGWLALSLTIGAVLAFHKASARAIHFAGPAVSLLAFGALTAFRFSQGGGVNWAALHVLLAMFVVIAWVLLAARGLPRRPAIARRSLALISAPRGSRGCSGARSDCTSRG